MSTWDLAISVFDNRLRPPQSHHISQIIGGAEKSTGSSGRSLRSSLHTRWRKVFWIKGGQLDPPVGDVTFFGSKEVRWIPLLVASHVLDHRRSVGSPCWWRHIFRPKDVRLITLLLSSRFWTTGIPWGLCLFVCLFVTSYPHHQFSKGCFCLFVTFHPHQLWYMNGAFFFL